MNIEQKKKSVHFLVWPVLIFSGIYAVALISENQTAFVLAKTMLIPLLLVSYFAKRTFMPNLYYSIFILFFIGNLLSLITTESLAAILSNGAYIISYMLLISVVATKLKGLRLEGIVLIYLVLVGLIISYMIFTLFDLLRDSFSNSWVAMFYAVRSLALLAMCFFAFTVYLAEESKQAILFVLMSSCFVFSDMMNYVSEFYVYYWMFDWLGMTLQLLGLSILGAWAASYGYQKNPFKPMYYKVGESNRLNGQDFVSELTQ